MQIISSPELVLSRPMQSYLGLSPWRHCCCYCPVHMLNLRLRLITFPVHPEIYFIMQSRPYYLQHTFQYCIQDPPPWQTTTKMRSSSLVSQNTIPNNSWPAFLLGKYNKKGYPVVLPLRWCLETDLRDPLGSVGTSLSPVMDGDTECRPLSRNSRELLFAIPSRTTR